MITLQLKNNLDEISRLEGFVDQMISEYDIAEALSFPFSLALDEAVSNVIYYAYDKPDMPLELQARIIEGQPRRLCIEIIDWGKPFDPLANAPDVDTSMSAENRQIGGLGIFIIRQSMDDVVYRREDDRNILSLYKNV